jgi:hypothetical protein
MKWRHWKLLTVVVLTGFILCAAAYVAPADEADESEREVTEAQVPAAALATLKKLAAGAEITEFAEEVEHGHTFYEGSWKGPSGGDTDVLVTPDGDLVEIEEQVSTDKVPSTTLRAARRAAGKGTGLVFEKKTMILYEVKFRKGNRRHELLLTPDGRRVEEEVEKAESGRHDEDEDDGDEEEEVSIDEVPGAVKATILKHAKGGKITEVERENEDGKVIYEAEVIIDGKEVDLKVAPNGRLLGKEVEDEDDESDDDDDDDEGDDDEDDDDDDD